MCDQNHHDPSSWISVYQHYMHQHAVMMQYFQHLHQNTAAANYATMQNTTAANYATMQNTTAANPYSSCYACCCECQNTANSYCRQQCRECSSASYSSSVSSSSDSCTTSSYSSEYEVKEEASSESSEDDDESECGYELNVDAIIAMRAAKKDLNVESASKSSTSESGSIVVVDSEKEEFEFVELGSLKTLSSKLSHGIGAGVNRRQELEAQKNIMNYLYGEKSAAIAGLEAAMAVDFEQLCDTHQPSLWPVLPVRL